MDRRELSAHVALDVPARRGRHVRSQDDPGTLLGDRKYRPDVEGLRAVAVGAVILFHAKLVGFTGGFVGVDVFYVISGFVITGVLLRKFESSGSLGFKDFYARRARRILPAAGFVLIATILASYHWLGFIRGAEVADDARWCAVFLANFHFLSIGTNYFSSQLPPSPLQNYWSLAVEEQFYLVYPCALALSLIVIPRLSVRHKVMIFTGVVILGSLYWSIYQTSADPYGAYLSSLTRAWELAVGGFVAAGTQYWLRMRRDVAACATWLGIAGILIAATEFTGSTPYPGWAALLPVASAALIIAGGMSAGRWGVELLLGTAALRWLGKLSYSLYLWSWPVLTIAAQSSSKPLSLTQRLLTIVASLVLAALTYAIVENPIRHSKWVAVSWRRGILLGVVIICAVLIVATLEIHTTHTL
jgi:peptidoglycan/LPS O-acetylase OafA/YrhL